MNKQRQKLLDLALFGSLIAIMFLSKRLMEFLPNMHLLGTFIVSTTVVYRAKALFPLYGYVFLDGLLYGFSAWWVPYLYVWTVLWGMAMLIPQKLPQKIAPFVYMGVSGLHGLLFGVLYAPAQALLFGLNLEGTVAWVIAGLPFDAIHCVSNVLCGTLIAPLIKVMKMFRYL